MNDADNGDSTPSPAKHALFVACSRRDGVVIAKLVGPSIGQREAPIISHAVISEVDKPGEPPYAAVLDFGRVTFLNSMGLGMCIEIRNRMHELGGKTILYRPSEQIVAVLKLTKMDRLYTIVNQKDTLEKALRK